MFQTEEFDLALNQLMSDVQAGQPFTPLIKNIFKSYDLCALEDVKVVIVGNHPHPDKGVADGLAFSGYDNPFVKALTSSHNDLKDLPAEGVLLLTAGLTCPIGKATDHMPMWAPLTEKLIKAISYRTVKTIFVFVGKETEHLGKQVGRQHLKFFLPDVIEGEEWDHDDAFDKINKALNKMEKTPVNW